MTIRDQGGRNSAQGELFYASTTWVHVLNAMIENGDCAAMRPFAFTVYVVIKAHASFRDGMAFPSIDTIAGKTGISRRQVITCLGVLEESGYLLKERRGRRNHYRLREKVEVRDANGIPAAVATWDYRPSAMREALDQIKAMLKAGNLDLGHGKYVIVKRLNMNIQVNSGPGIQVNGRNADPTEE